MGWWNDNNAFIKGNGNLTLGFGGTDDGAYDTTQTYAKGDVFWQIPLSAVQVAGGATSAFAAPTMAARQTIQGGVGVSQAVSMNSGNGTGSAFMLIPFNFFQRTTNTGPNNSNQPHGFKFKQLNVMYTPLGSNLTTAPVLTAWSETPANLTTRTTVVYDSAQITVQNPIGTTVATLPVAVNSAGFLVSYVITNPTFLSTINQTLWAELQFAIAAGSTNTVLVSNIVAVLSLALY